MDEKELANILTKEGFPGLKKAVIKEKEENDFAWLSIVLFACLIFIGYAIDEKAGIESYKARKEYETIYFCSKITRLTDSMQANAYVIEKSIKNKAHAKRD